MIYCNVCMCKPATNDGNVYGRTRGHDNKESTLPQTVDSKSIPSFSGDRESCMIYLITISTTKSWYFERLMCFRASFDFCKKF